MTGDDQAPPPDAELEAALQASAANLMRMGQLADTYLDAALGYKARCVEAGFAEADASRMAAEYHNLLMRP